jgi:hypothetical protein
MIENVLMNTWQGVDMAHSLRVTKETIKPPFRVAASLAEIRIQSFLNRKQRR